VTESVVLPPSGAELVNLSEKYRLKALACEKAARDAIEPVLKVGWAEIAIEWHALANRASQLSDDNELEIK
jgi:hypothetical protein